MEYEQIKKLINDMGTSNLSELEIDFPDGTKICMKKENLPSKTIVSSSKTETYEVKEEKNVTGNIVKSPMVGTFYLKPSPTAEPFVQVGKEVKQGDTLCIIEAMKLMNEIESEFAGKVKEVLVKDGEPVEYGTELFVIE